MKITFNDASVLGFFLSHPSSVTERKAMAGKEFTRCILFGVKKHGVAVLGCNHDSSFERIIPNNFFDANNVQEGCVAVLADKLMSFIKTYGKQPVTFELVDNLLHVKSGRSRVKIETYPAEGYPQPTLDFSETKNISLNIDVLQEGLKLVRNCMPTDNAMACLNGIRVQFNCGKLSFIATDGHRLSIYQRMVDVSGNPELAQMKLGFTIPVSAVNKLVSLTSESKEGTLSVSGFAFAYRVSSLVFQSKLIDDSRYPEIEKMIPKEHAGHFCFEKRELTNLLERMRIAVGATNQASGKVPRAEFTFNNTGLVTVIGGQSNHPDAEDEITPVEFIYPSSEVISSAMNYFLLSNSISGIQDDKVRITIAPIQNRGVIANYFIIQPYEQKPYVHFFMNLPVR